MPITPDKNVGDMVQLAVNPGRRRLGVDRGRGCKGLEGLTEVGEKGGRRRFGNRKELSREAQGGPKHHLRGGEANPLLGSGLEAEEDPGKLLVPKRTDAPGTESVLQGTVEPLHHPVGLRVVCSGLVVYNAEDTAKALPEAGNELGPAIGGQMGGDPKTGDPVGDEGVGTVGGGGGGHGDGLGPPGGAVHDGEKVFSPGGGRQGPDQVHMEVAEPPGGHGDGLHRGLGMAGHLAALAIQAGPGPGEGVRGHRRPEEAARNQSLGGAAAGVCKAVHGVEDLAAEMTGNQDPGITQGDITQQTLGPNLLDLELRVRGQRKHLFTQQLSRGQDHEVEGQGLHGQRRSLRRRGAAEAVSDRVQITGQEPDVVGELRQIGEMPLLAGTPRRRHPAESSTEGLVVGKQAKLAAFQGEPEMADGQVGAQQFMVEGRVAGLRGGELLREEGEWLPCSASAQAAPLLQGGADVGGGSISDDGKGGVGDGMGQPNYPDQEGLGGGEGGLHGGGPEEPGGGALEPIRQRGQNLGGILDEPPVKIYHAQEPLELLEVGGGRKRRNGLQVLGEGGDTGDGDGAW